MRKDVIARRIKLTAEVGNVRAPGPCPYCGVSVLSFVDCRPWVTFDFLYLVQHHCPLCNGLWTDFCRDDVALPTIAVLYAVRRGMHHAPS